MNHLETVRHFHLSLKAKEAIKVGLAFGLVYVIALKLSWLNPYWAGFAVAQIALFPAGQSLHNGALRAAGVVPAVLASLVIYTLAPQERWLFISLVAVWLTFTTYMMVTDEKRAYLWNVAGFATLAIVATHAETSVDIFDRAIYRAIETILGIVVYTLVTVFIWPDTNVAALKKLSMGLTSAQAKIFQLLTSQGNSPEVKKSLKETAEQEVQLLGALKHAFYAKGSETHEVQEAIGFWKEYHNLSSQLAQSFNRLNNSFMGLGNIDIYKMVPGLDEYREEINRRFELAQGLLLKGGGEFKIEPVVLEVDEAYLKSLTPFDQLAFASSRQELEKVAKLNQKILECANNIVNGPVSKKMATTEKQGNIYERLIPDIDHLKSAFFVGFLTLAGFCLWIFVDPPGHIYWMILAPTVGMMVAATPQMKTNAMVMPAIFILSFFLMIYVFIMPQLTNITELFALYFICIFCVFYFFTGMYRVIGVIGIVTKLMVNNEQTYDFASSANMVIWSVASYAFLYALSYMISSPRPQRVLLNLTRRYFRSAESLLSEIQYNKKPGIIRKFKIAFHRYEIRSLPLKIKAWSRAINHKDFPKNTTDEISDLLFSISSLSYSIEEWISSNNLHQTKYILSETKEELSKWNRGIESVFKGYQNDLDSSLSSQIETTLKNHIATLEEVINKHSEYIEKMKINVSIQGKENLFRLIGSYQGLSLSLISYASAAEQINWKHWEEEVFA